jgi:NAD/NADP transhydrogenase beta subunit
MNKRITGLVIFVGLSCLTTLVFGAGLTDPLGGKDFTTVLTGIATAVGNLIAGLGTVAFIIAGIIYIASTANPELRNTAKKALIYAIIGMVVGLSAGAIVAWVKTIVG